MYHVSELLNVLPFYVGRAMCTSRIRGFGATGGSLRSWPRGVDVAKETRLRKVVPEIEQNESELALLVRDTAEAQARNAHVAQEKSIEQMEAEGPRPLT